MSRVFTNSEKIGSNATFLGGQKGLITIGNHCYAYSGEVSVNQDPTTMLEFSIGEGYIIGEIQIACKGASGNDFFIDVKLNDQSVYIGFMSSDTTPYPTVSNPIKLLVPANSLLSLTLENDQTATRIWTASFVGKMYG